MSARHIHTNDITELVILPRPETERGMRRVNAHYPQLGKFNVANIFLPDIHILDIEFQVAENLIIHDTQPSNNIDVNFVLQDSLFGDFQGVDMKFQFRGGQHNLKYTPDVKHTHKVIRNDALKMFTISLCPDYFRELIGCEDAWSERTQSKIERGECFMGSRLFPDMTPRMRSLIHIIQNRIDEGSINRLRLQSMIFELLALQIDQFKSQDDGKRIERLPEGDIQKLYQIKQHIEQHFLDDLTLTGLCRIGLLNEFKLKKGFRKLFNTSVIHHVKKLRMEYARTLLQDRHVSVEEAAVTLGYQYPNHFAAAYKKHFGVGPSQRM